MNEMKIEFKNSKFFFLVNQQSVTIDYNVIHRTSVIFRGVVVYSSTKKIISESDARAMLWEYLESIQYSEKKNGWRINRNFRRNYYGSRAGHKVIEFSLVL